MSFLELQGFLYCQLRSFCLQLRWRDNVWRLIGHSAVSIHLSEGEASLTIQCRSFQRILVLHESIEIIVSQFLLMQPNVAQVNLVALTDFVIPLLLLRTSRNLQIDLLVVLGILRLQLTFLISTIGLVQVVW